MSLQYKTGGGDFNRYTEYKWHKTFSCEFSLNSSINHNRLHTIALKREGQADWCVEQHYCFSFHPLNSPYTSNTGTLTHGTYSLESAFKSSSFNRDSLYVQTSLRFPILIEALSPSPRSMGGYYLFFSFMAKLPQIVYICLLNFFISSHCISLMGSSASITLLKMFWQKTFMKCPL